MRIRNWSGVVAATGLAAILAACGNEEPQESGRTTGTPSPSAPPSTATPAPSPAATPAPVATPRKPKEALPEGAVERWYERREDGQKLGWLRVVWAPSTWQGKPTIHDTTTASSREARQMMETEDEFASESTTDTERGADGSLWWMRSVSRQSTQTTIVETTWTGDGYEWTRRIDGSALERRKIPADAPAHVDAEAALSSRAVAGALKKGERFVVRELDVVKRRVVENPGEVLGSEPGPGPIGDVPCTRVKVVAADSQTDSFWWIDGEGAVARLKELTTDVARVAEETARKKPASPASFSITTPAVPQLERIFSAERVLVDVHLRPDPDRPLPDIPVSPWSRVVGIDGDERKGHVIHVEMRAYDVPDAKATIPVTDPQFADDLASDPLFQCDHVDVQAAAKRAVDGETNARKAAKNIADFVFSSLRKESGSVAEATAVEILRTRQGDCSEHATLFVALCRAAGIPARKCSGFVCVGGVWGGHAWAEIWTGAWIGVDPTTADVGTAARYLFYGYPDRPGSNPGAVSARVARRMRLVFKHLDEGDDHVDFGGAETWTEVDRETGRARHHLTGLDLRGIPEDWKVTMSEEGCVLRAPGGLRAIVQASADQGYRRGERLFEGVDGSRSTFAGVPAVRNDSGTTRSYWMSSRRRDVKVTVFASRRAADDFVAQLEKVIGPSLTEKPTAP